MKRRLAFLLPVAILLIVACQKHGSDVPPMDPAIAKSIEKFEKRPIYKRLTPAVLASIPDAEVEQAVFDYAVSKIGDQDEREREVVLALPTGVRFLYVTSIVKGEVDNGGFNQFYWNSSGQFAPDASDAFEFFAATKHASLLREANEIHAREQVEIQKFKDKNTVEAFSQSYDVSKLGPLDDRFYKTDEDLSKLRVAKIRSAPELFSGE
jgi:hypothetical protein